MLIRYCVYDIMLSNTLLFVLLKQYVLAIAIGTSFVRYLKVLKMAKFGGVTVSLGCCCSICLVLWLLAAVSGLFCGLVCCRMLFWGFLGRFCPSVGAVSFFFVWSGAGCWCGMRSYLLCCLGFPLALLLFVRVWDCLVFDFSLPLCGFCMLFPLVVAVWSSLFF